LTDAGSGYAIGIDVLKAVWACYDGTGPATSLHEAVLKKLELQKTEDIIGWTYSDLAFFRVASLAILAFEEEAKGDKLARAIIESAADSIVRCLLGVARKLGFADSREPVPVVLSGSVASSPRMVELLRARLATAWPSAKLTPTLCEASVGAALLGMTLA
jgi:N-acetylglucosamine kinase-like BadF-type ATPase